MGGKEPKHQIDVLAGDDASLHVTSLARSTSVKEPGLANCDGVQLLLNACCAQLEDLYHVRDVTIMGTFGKDDKMLVEAMHDNKRRRSATVDATVQTLCLQTPSLPLTEKRKARSMLPQQSSSASPHICSSPQHSPFLIVNTNQDSCAVEDEDSCQAMDSHARLQERFGRTRNAFSSQQYDDADDSSSRCRDQKTTNTAIQQYFVDSSELANEGDWRSSPEIPTADELLRCADQNKGNVIRRNANASDRTYKCPWQEREQIGYLSAQYDFCREESTFALRKAVTVLQMSPHADEPDFRKLPQGDPCSGFGIYDKARVTGVFFATSKGLATRMSFSTARSRVRIDWKTSKRLRAGSLIAVSPAAVSPGEKRFGTIIPGIVAARPLSLVEQRTPEVDIFFPYDAIFDPSVEYVIVEETTGYFEGQRHNMLALQKMTRESFPLGKYILDPLSNQTVGMAANAHTSKDLSPALGIDSNTLNGVDYTHIDVRSDWPHHAFDHDQSPSLDVSQMEALKHMLGAEFALIQGPPGTGKTHVTVAALKVMLKHTTADDPPIVVACQTNHALDQLLRHVAKFEPNFIRLGGRSADKLIKSRTLFEVRDTTGVNYWSATGRTAAKDMRNIKKEIVELLKPLNPESGFFDHHLFLKHGVIKEPHFNAIDSSTFTPISDLSPNCLPINAITSWLHGKMELTSSFDRTPESIGFEQVEEELGDEVIGEDGAEGVAQDDEVLSGEFLPLAQKWTTKPVAEPSAEELKRLDYILESPTSSLLKTSNPSQRAVVYRMLVAKCKRKIVEKLLPLLSRYHEACERKRRGNLECDLPYLKSAKVIGLTTTGMSKYRALVAAAGVKIVVLEEAGECLECSILPALVPSIEQFIQVGDHKQLQPRAQKREHEDAFWGVSLFERLAINQVEMRMLQEQRRMRSEISRLLRPVYGPDLGDFEKEDLRPVVPGMGGFNTWFVDHQSEEGKDAQQSTLNEEEAKWVVELAAYLTLNGTPAAAITILTFYNGQKRRLLRCLSVHPVFRGRAQPGVHTVDSYQGEENEVILLSLVRSNNGGGVGFTGNANRINVALSRARLGLYVFGNKRLLEERGGPLWTEVLKIFNDGGDPDTWISDDQPELRIGPNLPIVCGCGVATHEADRQACREQCHRSHDPVTTFIESAAQMANLNGGCERKCLERLPSCGHTCPYKCHPMSHSEIPCNKACLNKLQCGHICIRSCREICACRDCPTTHAPPTGHAPSTRVDLGKASYTKKSKKTWSSLAKSSERPDFRQSTKRVYGTLAPPSATSEAEYSRNDPSRCVEYPRRNSKGLIEPFTGAKNSNVSMDAAPANTSPLLEFSDEELPTSCTVKATPNRTESLSTATDLLLSFDSDDQSEGYLAREVGGLNLMD